MRAVKVVAGPSDVDSGSAEVDSEERGFLTAIEGDPGDEDLRFVYADWLEDRGDPRARFVRADVEVRNLPADHPTRPALEDDLGELRGGLDEEWLGIVERRRSIAPENLVCDCTGQSTVAFHATTQRTDHPVWRRLLDRVDAAMSDGRREFDPLEGFSREERALIVTLPTSIGRLKRVERLFLGGSFLERIPPEIGGMKALREVDAYMSYRLHWYPHEIAQCGKLSDSAVSTRALYGNYKNRCPFPSLAANRGPNVRRACSQCGTEYVDQGEYRVWITLLVATDILPLLVNACSRECVDALPTPPTRYVDHPHRGGAQVVQPPPAFNPPR